MRGAPDTVDAAALAVGEPAGHRHHPARRAETLEPAVEPPQQHRKPQRGGKPHRQVAQRGHQEGEREETLDVGVVGEEAVGQLADRVRVERSEEHTSELQSLMRISYAVFCLKKKSNKNEKT